ncbi:unnamed protein product [Rotaria magnacalcarata]
MSLLNSFIDSVACVGFSSERGLKLDTESKEDGTPFTSSLQPSLLAIVTACSAMYPQLRGNEFIDPCYPPVGLTSSNSSRTSSLGSDRSVPIFPSAAITRTPKQHIPAAYNNIPIFCFPDGARATYERENERIHHIVFTQEEGKRIYALALTFQQSFNLKTNKPEDDGTYQIEDVNLATLTSRRPSESRIPIAIERQKSVTSLSMSATSTSTSTPQTPTVKARSNKAPISFRYSDASTMSQSQSSNSSTDANKKHLPHYQTHTIVSYMKDLSSTAQPPQSRMVRTNSQSNLAALNDTASMSTGVRKRSSSITSRTSSMKTIPIPTATTTTLTSMPIEITKPFYLPHCIVLVSTQPYWTAMQETISMIYDEIIRLRIAPNSNLYKQLIQKYAFRACNTPIPPIPWERFSLAFNLTNDQSVLTFDPPIDTNHTVLDLDLSILPLTLNIGKLLDILAAIFTQQPIIFFSSNYSKLVTTLECLLYLIYPLKWAHVYVPFVPDGLRDYYLEGPPGSYIMGAHSRHQSIVEDLNMSFTCNLDNNKNIHVPKDMEFRHLPPTKIQRFVTRITEFLEDIKVSRSLQNVHSPVRLRIDQRREFEHQQRIETNHKIIQIFLDLMVDLCGDALKPIYWKVNHSQLSPTNTLTRTSSNDTKSSNHNQTKVTFSKEKYLLSKTEGIELEFYRIFVETTAFQLLMDEEIRSTSPTVFRHICQLHSSSDENQFYHFNHLSSEENNDDEDEDEHEATTLYDSMSSQMLLPLPDWPTNTSTHYLDICIELFTSELKNAQQENSPSVIAVYAYLRGCALLARGQYLDGLRDLYLIENPNLFPREYIETVVLSRLADECLLDLFFNESYYTNAPEWKKLRTRATSQRMSIIDLERSGGFLDDENSVEPGIEGALDNEWNIIEKNLTYEQFSEHVHHSRIVLDNETTQKLFNALMYWTDSTITKTLKKDKTLTANKSSETTKPTPRRLSITGTTLIDTLTMLNGVGRGNQNATVSSKSSISSNSTLPIVLFESFLDNWQRTNAEKVRMNRCLPEDRQKKESILKISSSGIVSKADGPGKLLLTQKRLYFLPETRSFARVLTELVNITSVEKYQHQTAFSSSKPGIKVYAAASTNTSSLPRDSTVTLKSKLSSSSPFDKDSKSSIRLIFKNCQEQELWYIIIVELWSGVTISNEQCDTSVLNKASRHIALMDTLANIDYDDESTAVGNKQGSNYREKPKQRHNEASLDMALNDLSICTQIRKEGALKPLSVETRNVLTRRLSPSINETGSHAVRCLVCTEHPENGRSSLWCAYGSKLKVYNSITWVCDPTDILFPSLITCMCVDSRNKMWVGCIDGQLFVVDTVTHVCGAQLASIRCEGGCQTMVFDVQTNHILTASRSGSVTIWNATNWERLNEINLCELYRTTQSNQERIYQSKVEVTLRAPTQSLKSGKNSNRKEKVYPNSKSSTNEMYIPNIPVASGPAPIIPSPTDKLERIQVYDNLLFACYRDDYLLSLRISDSNTYTYESLISVKYKKDDSTPIDAFIAYNKQLWVSAGCIIYIFSINDVNDENSDNLLMKKPVDDDRLVTLLGFSGYIWAGSLRGNVYVFRMDNYERFKTFAGHHDSVCCLCPMLNTYVISGSSQNDASIAIWDNVQISTNTTNSLASSSITTSTIEKSKASAPGTSTSTSRIPRKAEATGENVNSINML